MRGEGTNTILEIAGSSHSKSISHEVCFLHWAVDVVPGAAVSCWYTDNTVLLETGAPRLSTGIHEVERAVYGSDRM